jgi:NlpC/P60 family putative phage cell wall peptidase
MADALHYLREAIVIEAREWVGTRYKHQASLKGVGCDCIGLIAGVGRALGFQSAERFDRDPRFRAYSRTPEPKMLFQACAEYLEPVPLLRSQPGDILLTRFKDDPQHFALLADRDGQRYMVHSYTQARKVVENRIDDTWLKRIVSTFKFREVPA